MATEKTSPTPLVSAGETRTRWFRYDVCFSPVFNRPFPSSLVPLFQSKSKCETILIKMTFICMKMKLHAELIFI